VFLIVVMVWGWCDWFRFGSSLQIHWV